MSGEEAGREAAHAVVAFVNELNVAAPILLAGLVILALIWWAERKR